MRPSPPPPPVRRRRRKGGSRAHRHPTADLGRLDTNVEHHASTCRWAVPTLFLPAPFWWEADDRPWSCIRGAAPRVLETTEVCATCPYWEPIGRDQVTADMQMILALREALEDAYRARATYRKAIEAFGPIRPFVHIMQAEARHVRALRALLDRLGAEPPQDTWADRVPAPDTLAEACAAAVRAEIDKKAMYERLMPLVRDPAARRLLRRFEEASQLRHLPAFRRCFARAMKPSGRPRGVRTGRSEP